MARFVKRWWLEHKLPDGNLWNGWCNVHADSINDFPSILKGEYWVEKVPNGWRGYFWLNTQTESDAIANGQYVITGGIWRPEKSFSGANLRDPSVIHGIMEYNSNIVDSYNILPRFRGRLEKDIVLAKSKILNY